MSGLSFKNLWKIRILLKLIDAIVHKKIFFKDKQIEFQETAALILKLANGDARKLCNMLEMIGSLNATNLVVDDELITKLVQENPAIYDKDGEMHLRYGFCLYKINQRPQDPNAALY